MLSWETQDNGATSSTPPQLVVVIKIAGGTKTQGNKKFSCELNVLNKLLSFLKLLAKRKLNNLSKCYNIAIPNQLIQNAHDSDHTFSN